MDNSGTRTQFLRQNLGAHRRCLKSALAQVWTWRRTQDKVESFHPTVYKYEGLLCLVEDFSNKKSYHLQLHCVDKGTVQWKHELEDLTHLSNPEEFLDLYDAKESVVFVNYSDMEEKAHMKQAIERTIRKIKRLKEDPDYAKRKADIEYFFEEMGIADSDFIDSKTRSFIYDFIKTKNEAIAENKISNIVGEDGACTDSKNDRSDSSKNIEIIDKIVSELVSYDQRKSRSSNGKEESQKLGIFPDEKIAHEPDQNNHRTIYSKIQHKEQENIEIKEQVSEEEEESDYVEILHEDRNGSYSSEALYEMDFKNDTPEFNGDFNSLPQYEFMQRNTLPIVKPRTVLLPAPPIPPKLKRNSFKKPAPQPPDCSWFNNTTTNDTPEANTIANDNKLTVVPAPRRGRISKEDIGPPFNFQHLVHMGSTS